MRNNQNWTQEEKELLITLFPNTTDAELSVIFERTENSVRMCASRLKIRKSAEFRGDWTQKDKEKLIEIYANTKHKELESIFKRPANSITIIANSLGLYKSAEFTAKENSARSTKYSVNHNYFHDIDRPDKAYWFGWMWSDGYIAKDSRKTTYKVGLTLKNTDRIIIELLRRDIEANYPIFDTKNNACGMNMHSPSMFRDLVSHGVIPNKSLLAEEPIGIPDHLLSHFVRGVFDGDGSVGFYNYIVGKRNQVSILGTKIFCEWLNETIYQQLGFYRNIVLLKSDNNITSRYDIKSLPKIQKFGEWIYQNCGEHKLERKYNKFIENGLL